MPSLVLTQVRQLVAALKVNSAMRLATRERTPTAAAATLADTVRHSPQRKATFLAEDGAVALIELLNSRKPDVSRCCEARATLALCACSHSLARFHFATVQRMPKHLPTRGLRAADQACCCKLEKQRKKALDGRQLPSQASLRGEHRW